MSTKLVLTGFAEQQQEWRRLPVTLTRGAQAQIDPLALQTAGEIRAAYPRRTGALARGVTVVPGDRRSTRASSRIINTSAIAGIYEQGSGPRQTRGGAARGAMPAGPVFIPRLVRARRTLEPQLATVMRDEGLTVTRG